MNTDTINEWAEQYTFEQLNAEKQKAVLLQMSGEEFDELHYTLASFGGFLIEEKERLEPRVSLFADLSNTFDLQLKGTLWARIVAIKIPAYQAIAACFIAALGTYLLADKTKENTLVVEKEAPVYELVRDTVFKEIAVVKYITKTVIKNMPKETEAEKITTSYTPQENYAQRQPSVIPSMEEVTKSFGNSSVNAETLEKFKVRM